MLLNASQQTIETVEEAYAWIGNNLGPEADDSFVVTMFSVRVSLSLPSPLLPSRFAHSHVLAPLCT